MAQCDRRISLTWRRKQESACAEVPTLPKVLNQLDTGYDIGGMAILQSLSESYFKTFEDLTQQVLKRILRRGIRCCHSHVWQVWQRWLNKADGASTSACWKDHTQSLNHRSPWSAKLSTFPKRLSKQGRPVCIYVRINCFQCISSTETEQQHHTR